MDQLMDTKKVDAFERQVRDDSKLGGALETKPPQRICLQSLSWL